LRRLRGCHSTAALFEVWEDVEDALANAAASALAHLARFDETRGTADAWLWILTRNAAVSILRHRGRWYTAGSGPVSASVIDLLVEDRYNPAALAEYEDDLRDARARIARALPAADPVARQAWELRFIQEKSYAAISEELGVPVGTLATWFHRLKKNARTA
jgi:RNA polymerase sigma factor (sigma-70 family)